MTTKLQAMRSRVGGLRKSRPADHPEVVEAVRDLKAEVLADHVARVVSEAPKLSPEQLDRIGAILRGGAR